MNKRLQPALIAQLKPYLALSEPRRYWRYAARGISLSNRGKCCGWTWEGSHAT